MSTPIYVDTVKSVSDIAIRYVNHLLTQHAMDQSMLANQEPPDERCRRRISELSVKLELSEHANKNLLSMVEQQKLIIEGQRQRLAQYENVAQDATSPFSAEKMRDVFEGKSPVDRLRAQGINVHFTEDPKPKVIDGDEAIREGRAALDRHMETARQPDRGE